MGKGYNNYMTKKPFHPGSKANIKRTWMAEQKTENEKRKQEDLKTQYDKEQDLYNNRALLSTESKEKLQLNFMYEAPPGAKRERQKEDDEPEYKFEWQRKYNAPREDYAKGNEEIRDQPFGIPVRNVRCIKCHKWGHINTDRECPLFSQSSSSAMPTTSMDPLELMRQMREDGYDIKRSALGHQMNPKQANQQFIPSDESDPEMDFLKSLSAKEKRKLLKKLNRLSKKQKKKKEEMKKKKDKKKSKSQSKKKLAESDSDSEEEQKPKNQKKRRAKQNESDSESSDVEEKPILKEKKAKADKKMEKVTLSSKHHKHAKKQSDKKKHNLGSKYDLDSEGELPTKKIKREFPEELTPPDKLKMISRVIKTEKLMRERNCVPVDSDTRPKSTDEKSKKSQSDEQATSSKEATTVTNKPALSQKPKKATAETKSDSSSSSSDESTGNQTKDCEKQNAKSKRAKSDSQEPDTENKKEDNQQHKKLATSPSTSTMLSDGPSSKSDNGKHPDDFDPDFPQRTFSDQCRKENDQDALLHERFRNCHRHRRSPSVKHKYRND